MRYVRLLRLPCIWLRRHRARARQTDAIRPCKVAELHWACNLKSNYLQRVILVPIVGCGPVFDAACSGAKSRIREEPQKTCGSVLSEAMGSSSVRQAASAIVPPLRSGLLCSPSEVPSRRQEMRKHTHQRCSVAGYTPEEASRITEAALEFSAQNNPTNSDQQKAHARRGGGHSRRQQNRRSRIITSSGSHIGTSGAFGLDTV